MQYLEYFCGRHKCMTHYQILFLLLNEFFCFSLSLHSLLLYIFFIALHDKQKRYDHKVRNSRVTKSSYETELRKMTSYFELLTWVFLQKYFFGVTNSTLQNIKLNFELLTRSWKIKRFTSSYKLEVGKWKITLWVEK